MTSHHVTFPAPQKNMWTLKAVILLLFCSVCLPTENDLVYFNSTNFINTLHWSPVEPAVPGENITYKYSVEYKIYADGEEYRRKAGCQNITVLFCDLTEETPAISDGHYLARVFVNGEPHGFTKTKFTPLARTTLGPPTLYTKPTVSALHVHAIPPLGPNGESISDIIARSKKPPHASQLLYTLQITDPIWAAQVEATTTGQFILNLKNNNTKYCGHVSYRPKSNWGRAMSEKAFFCVKLPADPLNLLPWLLLTAVCLLALLVISFVCVWRYVKGGKTVSIPATLIISKTSTKVLEPDNETITISKLVVYPGNTKRDSATIHPKPTASLGGYTAQDVLGQIWQDSSPDRGAFSLTSGPEDNSAQSSVSYSIVAVHQPTEDPGAFTDPEIRNKLLFPGVECGSNHGITPEMATHWGSPLSVEDSPDIDPSKPLLLHAVRDSDGKLTLPFPSHQFQSSKAELQRRPLLSDLIDCTMEQPSLSSLLTLESECDDSMATSQTQTYCNSHYHQAHAVIPSLQQGNLNCSSSDGRSDSCYKQNWMPEVNVETVSMHSDSERKTDYPCSWNGLKKEQGETEEDKKELERFPLSEHFLGNWVVQIQD